jgi:hypothetical protein
MPARLDRKAERFNDRNGRYVHIADKAGDKRSQARAAAECEKAVATNGAASKPVHIWEAPMRLWARASYVAAFLVMATLPFDPFLNQRFLVYPVSVICVAVGLAALYLCTSPNKGARTRQAGGGQ